MAKRRKIRKQPIAKRRLVKKGIIAEPAPLRFETIEETIESMSPEKMEVEVSPTTSATQPVDKGDQQPATESEPMFELVEHVHQGAKIKVIGVGGAGGNAINTMIRERLEGVDFIAANTDLQALKANASPNKIQMGRELTKGLGAGANPDVGRNAALEDQRSISDALIGADMVFVTAGMGGGTGTGAAPVIARAARECGALTVGIVTKPFTFEGKKRSRVAEEGISQLRDAVDTLITIPNEKLVSIAGRDATVLSTFKMADEVLLHAVKGISDLITVHGLINLDFADVRTVMNEMGMALMGTGVGVGENRAIDAATKAISSPLLENVSIRGATGLLINITGGPDMTLHEVNEASKLIQEEAHEDANVIFGAVIDDSLTDELRVTVIATGFNRGTKGSVRGATRTAAGRTAEPWAGSPRAGIDWAQMPLAASQAQDGDETPLAQPRISGVAAMAPRPTPVVEVPQPALRHAHDAALRHAQGSVVRQADDSGLRLQSVEEKPVVRTAAQVDLREIMEEVGLSDFREDEYDIPTFLRKQAD